jgi:hypothetical protein
MKTISQSFLTSARIASTIPALHRNAGMQTASGGGGNETSAANESDRKQSRLDFYGF